MVRILLEKMCLTGLLKSFFFASVLLFSHPAQADFWSKARGVITDPFKIGEGSKNVVRAVELAMIHAEKLLGQAGKNFDGYIIELDRIVGETRDSISQDINEIGRITDRTMSKVSDLQQTFFEDAKALTDCVVEVSAFRVRETSAQVLNDLGRRNTSVSWWGWRTISVDFTPQDFPSPILGYRQALMALEEELAQVSEQDPFTKITDIYGEIGRLSYLVKCHYDEDSAIVAEMYLRELDQIRKSRPWVNVIVQ